MKKILMISFRFPYPLTSGANIRIYNIGKILAKRYYVDLLVLNESSVANENLVELEKIFNKVVVYFFHPLKFKINTLRGLLSKYPLQVYYYYFSKVQRWIDQHYANYDLILCFHIRMAEYLRKITYKPKVIDLIDATSINYSEAQNRAKGLWKYIYQIENKRLLPYELKIIKEFDKAFITSPFDKAYLSKYLEKPNNNLSIIPNGVKEELFFRQNKLQSKEEDWLVFLGKMDYAPNVDAVTYFAKEVFPLIKLKTDATFIIVGTSPTKEVLRLGQIEGIKVTGFVEDPYEYLEKAKVVVVPLRFSAGIQNKVLEAMALKKPVLTTSKAVRGIKGENGKHYIIANDKVEMAAKAIELLANRNKRKKLGESGMQLVKEKFRWEVVGNKLLKEIDEVLNR